MFLTVRYTSGFLSYRKLRFHTIKTLRGDAHSAQGKMVAKATAPRRENVPRHILFSITGNDAILFSGQKKGGIPDMKNDDIELLREVQKNTEMGMHALEVMRCSHFCWNMKSPTDSTSSTIRISGMITVAIAKAIRATMPEE